MNARSSDSRLRISGRLRVEYTGAPDASTSFPLPRPKTWPIALMCGALFSGFLVPEIDIIGDLLEQRVDSVMDLAGMMFSAFWALGWSVAVLILLAATLVAVFFRDEFRASGGKLEYICRAGPVQLVEDYEMARISEVRTGDFAAKGLMNICIDYDGATEPLGRALPEKPLAEALDFIRQALEQRGGTIATPAPAPAPKPEIVEPAVERPSSKGGARWLPVVFLVAANLVPLVGVLAFGWDLAQLM